MKPASLTPASVTCGRCHQAYDSNAWTDLELVEVLDSDCVRQTLSDWQAGFSIEVRRCAGCGKEIARRVSA